MFVHSQWGVDFLFYSCFWALHHKIYICWILAIWKFMGLVLLIIRQLFQILKEKCVCSIKATKYQSLQLNWYFLHSQWGVDFLLYSCFWPLHHKIHMCCILAIWKSMGLVLWKIRQLYHILKEKCVCIIKATKYQSIQLNWYFFTQSMRCWFPVLQFFFTTAS